MLVPSLCFHSLLKSTGNKEVGPPKVVGSKTELLLGEHGSILTVKINQFCKLCMTREDC